MAAEQIEVVGLGEILWDLLPDGREAGGAPFNFAFHCHRLGHPAAIVSRVGADQLGRDLRTTVRSLGLADAHIQEDADRPTGTVTVALDARGQPTFTIAEDVAYDHLAWDDELGRLCEQARAVCFGTLAQRHPAARQTIRRAVQAARSALVVYDVNLRQHFHSREIIEESLTASRWVKLNEEELRHLRGLLDLAGDTVAATLAGLRARYGLELAALTRGERGCLVVADGAEIDLPGIRVRVVDTVGAGDAFTAGLLAGTLEGKPLAEAATFANRLAARVAASAGATPVVDRAKVEKGLLG
jgi:fructokinase